MSTPDLQRLAEHVATRRRRIRLSVRRIADLAGISKDTWGRVERGEPVRDATYDAVESALGWTAGSCQKVMDGGEALLLEEESVGIAVVPPEAFEDEIRDAVQGALIATTDDLTAAQIRSVNERAIEVLRARGVLPPKG